MKDFQIDEKEQTNRTIVLLHQLWEKFKIQPVQFQLVTLFVMLLTFFCLIVFYSTFVIWQIFSYLMTKVLLRTVEWYLAKSNQNTV